MFVKTYPSAVAVLQSARSFFEDGSAVWEAVGMAAADLCATAQAEREAGAALHAALCERERNDVFAFDLAIVREQSRRLDLDGWLDGWRRR